MRSKRSSNLDELIQAIHDAPPRLVYAFTGAGSLALHQLHAVAGSSRTVLEAVDCYAPRSLAALVGGPLTQAVSDATAEALADWAWQRAATLAEGPWPLLGVGCTAAIATDRARRGADRAIVAVRATTVRWRYDLLLAKGQRARVDEEALVSRLVILAIAAACGLAEVVLELGPDETLHATMTHDL